MGGGADRHGVFHHSCVVMAVAPCGKLGAVVRRFEGGRH